MKSEDAARKVALVTGASRRLGGALARAFAREAYDLIVHYHESRTEAEELVEEIRSTGMEAVAVGADLSEITGIERLVDEIGKWTSVLDVLVHNAAVFPHAPFEDVTPRDWDRTLNLNTRSIFFLTRALVPLLLRAASPAVVNIASLGGFDPWRNHIPYAVSKAGVIMLTRALAKELAPRIRVNAVAPGIIVPPDETDRTHLPVERIPLRRYGNVREYVDTVLFLSTKATYITGQVIPLDGGMLGASTKQD